MASTANWRVRTGLVNGEAKVVPRPRVGFRQTNVLRKAPERRAVTPRASGCEHEGIGCGEELEALQ